MLSVLGTVRNNIASWHGIMVWHYQYFISNLKSHSVLILFFYLFLRRNRGSASGRGGRGGGRGDGGYVKNR